MLSEKEIIPPYKFKIGDTCQTLDEVITGMVCDREWREDECWFRLKNLKGLDAWFRATTLTRIQ